MNQPVYVNATDPLVIRPLKPHGFVLETLDGRQIVQCAVDYTTVTFRMSPLPGAQGTVVLEMTWIEQ